MELTLDQALQKGIEAHKAGKAQEADRYYTAILKANPKHPDANHNMGVLAVGIGKVQEALPFFKTALEANDSIAQYWLSYIDALIKIDQIGDAKAALDQAKSKGANGDGFDQLEQRIKLGPSKNSNSQDPSQEELDNLINLYTQRQYQETLTQALKLLEKFPRSFTLYNIVGVTNHISGKAKEAVRAYKKAISIKPDFAEAHNNLGITLKDQGKLDEALEVYNNAISIKPDYAEAFNNMGVSLKEQGKLVEAIKAYKKALAIKPDYAEAYYNMGNALHGQGKTEEAIEAYNKALTTKPDYTEAYNNMGNAFHDLGKMKEAIEAYTKALSIKPDYADAHYNMGNALKDLIFKKPNKELQKNIISLLDKETYIRPKDIVVAAISLLKFEQDLQKHLQLVETDLIESPLDVISDLSKFPLLLKLMSVCPLPDLELEGLLTKLRFSILSNITSLEEASSKLINFQSALALQCFTNEYIYNQTEDETKILQSLDASVKKALNDKKQPSPQAILTLASYKALNEYDWCKSLVVTDDIKEVYIHQVEEPNHEENLKKDLPILEEVTDKISSKVRAQYEESPYPRWVNLRVSLTPLSIPNVIDQIKLKPHDNKITEIENPDILIAGCGTGQHSIGTAARFKGSNVLAIDLSLSSLAYAKRKTDELGIGNIKYMQADILDLAKLKKKFDIIESVGVLHHMDNPMIGWKVLTNCLKTGGLMKIGLYSELARQDIVKIRKEISRLGIGSSGAEIKSFRKILMTSNEDHHTLITKSPDFYSLSTLRDLLFHVQEHRFTIPQLKDHFDKLGLKFCGFESKHLISHFEQTNKTRGDAYDLDKWHTYEKTNPRAFIGMYQLWCQKIN